MKIQTTKIYAKIQKAIEEGYTTVSLQGSSRSSKTFNTLIWLIVYCLNNPNTRLSIVRATLPAIKGSVLIDFKEILHRMGLFNEKALNKTDLTYHFTNGSWVEFFSTDSEQKLRGRKRDILFVNEANELSFIEWQQLKMRTTRFAILDYNPSFSDEHWLCEVNNDKRTHHFISTYKDNPFLEQTIVDEIESLQHKNPTLWSVYGLGLQAMIEGLIFPKYTVVETIPTHIRKRWVGIDLGFTCFKGDTPIMTDIGNKKISEIKIGDKVFTRNGYKEVKKVFNNGAKEIVKRRITLNNGKNIVIEATNNHLFCINGKWKKYGELTEKDNLYVLSSIMEEGTTDIQVESIPITTTQAEGEANIRRCCTTQFGGITTETSPKVRLFITSMKILLIMIFQTLWLLLHRNTLNYTTIAGGEWRCKILTKRVDIQKKIGTLDEELLYQSFRKLQSYVAGVVKNMQRQMYTKDFALKSATIYGSIKQKKTTKQECVSGAEQNIKEINITNQNLAQKSVPINYLQVSKVEEISREVCVVYDIEVVDKHEYFANGILVHNCDPTAITEVAIDGDKLYVDEICYKTQMLTSDIIRVLKENHERHKIICESADPRMIQEIYRAGLNIHAVKKFAGSIEAGILKMQEYNICVTKRSTNIIKELKNYTYLQDKEGKWLNRPVDCFNHANDSIRYVLMNEVMGGDKKKINILRISKII